MAFIGTEIFNLICLLIAFGISIVMGYLILQKDSKAWLNRFMALTFILTGCGFLLITTHFELILLVLRSLTFIVPFITINYIALMCFTTGSMFLVLARNAVLHGSKKATQAKRIIPFVLLVIIVLLMNIIASFVYALMNVKTAFPRNFVYPLGTLDWVDPTNPASNLTFFIGALPFFTIATFFTVWAIYGFIRVYRGATAGSMVKKRSLYFIIGSVGLIMGQALMLGKIAGEAFPASIPYLIMSLCEVVIFYGMFFIKEE